MEKNKLEELIKYLEKQIVDYQFNLKQLKKDDSEFIGFCRGVVEGFTYVRQYLKENLND